MLMLYSNDSFLDYLSFILIHIFAMVSQYIATGGCIFPLLFPSNYAKITHIGTYDLDIEACILRLLWPQLIAA